jgi:hypothetical protein
MFVVIVWGGIVNWNSNGLSNTNNLWNGSIVGFHSNDLHNNMKITFFSLMWSFSHHKIVYGILELILNRL